MKRIFFVIMLALGANAQKVRLGDVNMRNVVVVTNETDTAALEAVGAVAAIADSNTTHRLSTANPHATTLAQAATAGGFAGTETIGPLRVTSQWFDPAAPDNVSGTGNMGFGLSTATDVTGDYNMFYGIEVANKLTGNENIGVGRKVFDNVTGTGNIAVGGYVSRTFYNVVYAERCYGFGRMNFSSVYGAISNSVGIGINNGKSAQGEYKLWMDVSNNSNLKYDDNAIYIDIGQLNLGRTGSLTNASPNKLRGVWVDDSNTPIASHADLDAYVQTSAIPGPGCTDLGTATLLTGATFNYRAAPTSSYVLGVTNTAPVYTYAIMVFSTNAYTVAADVIDIKPITPSGTNVFTFSRFETNATWHVFGRAM